MRRGLHRMLCRILPGLRARADYLPHFVACTLSFSLLFRDAPFYQVGTKNRFGQTANSLLHSGRPSRVPSPISTGGDQECRTRQQARSAASDARRAVETWNISQICVWLVDER